MKRPEHRNGAPGSSFDMWWREVVMFQMIALGLWVTAVCALVAFLAAIMGRCLFSFRFLFSFPVLILLGVLQCFLDFRLPDEVGSVGFDRSILKGKFLLSCSCICIGAGLQHVAIHSLLSGSHVRYSFMFGFPVGLLYCVDYVLRKRYRLAFSFVQVPRLLRWRAAVPQSLRISLRRCAISYALSFLLLRSRSFRSFLPSALLSAFLVSVLSELVGALARSILTERLSFSSVRDGGSVELLLSGLSSKRSRLKNLAFLDVRNLAHFYRDRREAVLADVSGDSWLQICESCLKEVDTVDSTIQSILKLYRQVAACRSMARPPAEKSNGDLSVPKILPISVFSVECAVDGLGTLIQRSFEEDSSGTVQGSVPLVLQRLTSAHATLEMWKSSADSCDLSVLGATFPGLRRDWAMGPISPKDVDVLIAALRSSIYAIVVTFFEHLSYFKFPPETVNQLNRFLRFQV